MVDHVLELDKVGHILKEDSKELLLCSSNDHNDFSKYTERLYEVHARVYKVAYQNYIIMLLAID